MSLRKSQSGFTLLEVLVASIIMMVSLLGLGALQSTSMQKNISAMHLSLIHISEPTRPY